MYLSGPGYPAAQTVLVNGRFTPELSSAHVTDSAIWMRDGLIEGLGSDDDLVAEARTRGAVSVVDLEGAYLLPGLINMHTHFGVVHPGTSDEVNLLGETEAGNALRMAGCAEAALQAGVTTVRLVSERHPTDFALRTAIRRGSVAGPRIFTAGQALTATGGHGLGSHAVEADGVTEFRRHAREQIEHGADVIKLMISGGVSDPHDGLDHMEMAEDELRAAIQVAHSWGRPVAGHLGGADVTSRAIDLGVDSVEHGYALTEPVAAKMSERATWYVPTMLVTRGREYFERIEAPSWLIGRLEGATERHREAVGHAIAHSVRVLVGTDFLPSEPFDETTATIREIELLVEAGLPASEALAGATFLAAECLGQDRSLGFLSSGGSADVIATAGNPAADISCLRRLQLVVKAGHVVKLSASLSLDVRH